nr:acid phosphatase/vanadium-dependent haloperoxidase-related protein [Tanacetum cinerariifolium]
MLGSVIPTRTWFGALMSILLESEAIWFLISCISYVKLWVLNQPRLTSIQHMSSYSSRHVRSALASVIMCIAPVLGKDASIEVHVERQVEVLKQIVFELPAEHPLAESKPLHELLGYTPPQVCFNSGSQRMMLLEEFCRYSSSDIEPREIIPIQVV